MADYSGILYDVPFFVEVTDCRAVIDSSLVYVEDKLITWGDPGLPYSIDFAFSQYRQVPACGYNLVYRVGYEDVINNPGVVSLDSPPEISFDSITNTFYIEKCS